MPELEMLLLSDHGGSGGPIIDLNGNVVGLIQRGSRSGRTIESLDLMRFTNGDPSTLCGGVVAGSASTVCGSAPRTSIASSSNVYNGREFVVRYPPGWRISSAEVNKGSYLDTTISDPAAAAWLLRIDEGPGHDSASPEVAAASVLKALRPQAGYRELDLSRVIFLHNPALRWEFVVLEHGVLLHKVDIFFIDRGNDWAILFQAPASQWSQADPRFRGSVASLRVR